MSDFTYPLPDPKLNSYPLLSQDQLLQGDITLSEAFLHSKDCLLVVDHPEIFTTEFSYKRYCQKQNEWMRQYKKVYRFIEGDDQGKTVDRANTPYHEKDFLLDDHSLIQNILSNPFEKFERKRFMYYAKDLKKISIHHRIWDDLTRNNGIQRLENQMLEDLKNYYEPLGGY